MTETIMENRTVHQRRQHGRLPTAMHRALIAFSIAVALLIAVSQRADARAPSISVTPGSGNQFQTFTVSGSGFAARTDLWLWFTSPDGEEIVYTTEESTASITTNREGRFSITVMPAVDFAGARAGRWSVSVCHAET